MNLGFETRFVFNWAQFLLFIFFFQIHHLSYSQQNEIDSLKRLLKVAKSDTTRCVILSQMVEIENNIDIWPIYNDRIQFIAEKHLKVHPYPSTGSIFYSKQLAGALVNKSTYMHIMGDILKSIEYISKSLKISTQIKDKLGIASSLQGLGFLYGEQNEIETALKYFNQSLVLYRELNDKRGIASCYSEIGYIYLQNNDLVKSLEYVQGSIKIFEELNEQRALSFALNDIGTIYEKRGDLSEAEKQYSRSLEISKRIGEKTGEATTLAKLAFIMLKTGQLNKAQEYAKHILFLGQESPVVQSNVYNILYTVYKKQQKYALALEMHEKYSSLMDSVSNDKTKSAAIKSDLTYQYQKKTLEDNIKIQNERKLFDAKLSETHAKLEQEKTQRFALYGGLSLIILFSAFIFNRFKITQKQKNIIESQKLVVDESQRKMLDSINYAKKIQYSILPSKTEIEPYFPNHFVFFKPKDIVSGDFYWFNHIDDLSFIAVADCTGHGVPGAFMTMIAHSIITEVVIQQKIKSPELILKNLHHHLFHSLQQQKGDEYSQDGLDISFCVFDHQKNLLHFSGARNSAFILNKEEITTLRATQKSIGGLSLLGTIEPEREFKIETISIQKDSLLVMCTDGVFDQLNENDEKFGINRFKELILDIDEDFSNSFQITENTINDWKKSTIQLDDILILAIKFS